MDKPKYCLGMLMDSRVSPPTKIKISYLGFQDVCKELFEFINLLESIDEDVELIEILCYLKYTALLAHFENVGKRLKSIDPNSVVNIMLRKDDALILLDLLSMKDDEAYSSDLRIVRSLANQMLIGNPLLDKFAIKDFNVPTVKNGAVHVVQELAEIVKNDFKQCNRIV